jgi:hypothetical protein
MEAVAKFQFKATADDELSFEKGSIVKVSVKMFYTRCSFANIFSQHSNHVRRSSQIDVQYLGFKYGKR